MYLSAILTSLPLEFEGSLRQVRELGFAYADVVARSDRPARDLEALADSGLLVWCAAVGRGLPEGQTLDAEDGRLRRAAVEEMKRQLEDAARLGALLCYVVPGLDASPDGLARLADSCRALADHSASRMMPLCVEHVPGRALATVAATLAWLEQTRHDNLMLLLDVGHCLISEEDPSLAVVQAGRRLGYVHLDDNDSVGDLHWPLLTGRLTPDMLEGVLKVLDLGGYSGAVALELNPNNPDPVKALRDGRDIVREMLPGIRGIRK
jgi:sugar phosphate isomerase/epimerase